LTTEHKKRKDLNNIFHNIFLKAQKKKKKCQLVLNLKYQYSNIVHFIASEIKHDWFFSHKHYRSNKYLEPPEDKNQGEGVE
jgi:hypothetical protein